MAHRPLDHTTRIVSNLAIMGGKPVVDGTRIPVQVVLARLALNPDIDDLLSGYPRLTKEDIQACLSYDEQQVAKAPRASAQHEPANV